MTVQSFDAPPLKPGNHSLYPSGQRNPDRGCGVPIFRYPEMIVFSQKLVDDYRAAGYVFGHAGDGNLHVVLVGDPDNKKEWSTLEKINDQIVTRAVELGGTCTGEHGIGIGKRKFMELEHGQSYHLMRRIKDLIDPKGLLNPGKIFI